MTLLEMFSLMRKHLALVIALPIACALVAGVVSFAFLPNIYTASSSMYVLVKSDGSTNATMNTDLSASQMVTNDVANLVVSNRVTGDTARALGLDSLDDYDIDVMSETTTRVISLSVTGEDAQGTAAVANELAGNVSAVAQEVMDIQSVNVIDEASVPTTPSGPQRLMYTAVAFLAGLFVALALVVLMDTLDTKVRSGKDAEELLGYPVIGRIPTMREGV